MSAIPRIRGKVGQVTEPEDMKGKWIFEMWLTTFGGGDGDSLGIFGPFETEDIAKKELWNATKLAVEAYENGMDGKTSGKYIDMKTNEIRRWDRKDEH